MATLWFGRQFATLAAKRQSFFLAANLPFGGQFAFAFVHLVFLKPYFTIAYFQFTTTSTVLSLAYRYSVGAMLSTVVTS
jgi:hypothetical protein